jgi:hypothetical protein
MQYVIERWTGRAWAPSLESPFKSIAAVKKHLKDYYWHYTNDNPYRLIDFKPKKVKKYQSPVKKMHYWNSDEGMVIVNKVMR